MPKSATSAPSDLPKLAQLVSGLRPLTKYAELGRSLGALVTNLGTCK